MTKLNYKTADELVAAFNAGAKFEMKNRPGSHLKGPVVRMVVEGHVVRVLTAQHTFGDRFTPRGEYTGLADGISLVQVTDAPVSHLPFLQRFVMGEPAYCQATGEKVFEVAFECGELLVGLEDVTDNLRYSTSYRHDGTHKHDAKRNLTFTKPPESISGVQLFDEAPQGVYECLREDSKAKPGEFLVVLAGSGGRTVLYACNDLLEPAYRPGWGRSIKRYVKSQRKFTVEVK